MGARAAHCSAAFGLWRQSSRKALVPSIPTLCRRPARPWCGSGADTVDTAQCAIVPVVLCGVGVRCRSEICHSRETIPQYPNVAQRQRETTAKARIARRGLVRNGLPPGGKEIRTASPTGRGDAVQNSTLSIPQAPNRLKTDLLRPERDHGFESRFQGQVHRHGCVHAASQDEADAANRGSRADARDE